MGLWLFSLLVRKDKLYHLHSAACYLNVVPDISLLQRLKDYSHFRPLFCFLVYFPYLFHFSFKLSIGMSTSTKESSSSHGDESLVRYAPLIYVHTCIRNHTSCSDTLYFSSLPCHGATFVVGDGRSSPDITVEACCKGWKQRSK